MTPDLNRVPSCLLPTKPTLLGVAAERGLWRRKAGTVIFLVPLRDQKGFRSPSLHGHAAHRTPAWLRCFSRCLFPISWNGCRNFTISRIGRTVWWFGGLEPTCCNPLKTSRRRFSIQSQVPITASTELWFSRSKLSRAKMTPSKAAHIPCESLCFNLVGFP